MGKELATLLVAVLCLAACTFFHELAGAQLKEKLIGAAANSAESWWVLKEDADSYYLEDRLVSQHRYYKVSRKDVAIDLGPQPVFPIRLKNDDVQYLPTDKERVLASLLAGKWEENSYYSQDDCVRLCAMHFTCPAMISDCPFTDVLGDADTYQVRRTYYNFGGGVSRVETVAVQPRQYWELVRQVEKAG